MPYLVTQSDVGSVISIDGDFSVRRPSEQAGDFFCAERTTKTLDEKTNVLGDPTFSLNNKQGNDEGATNLLFREKSLPDNLNLAHKTTLFLNLAERQEG